jgi:deazaflavin-dependent oxidoreductase (nitroreductase family)
MNGGRSKAWRLLMNASKVPRVVWRLIRIPQLLYALGLGPLVGGFVLLLTTIGRKSGLPRKVPLQYEWEDGVVYLGSARGTEADWFRNILANPGVELQIGSRRYRGTANPLTDVESIADFLELRMRRHPRMMRVLLRMEGLSGPPSRADLEALSNRIAAVAVRSLEPFS